MRVAVIPWNDELRAGVIFRASDYADRILVITSNETVERLARIAGAEVIKQKDYDRVEAVYLGLKKAKEMGCKPVFIFEELSKDEHLSITPLLEDVEVIIGRVRTGDTGESDIKDIFNFRENNYRKILGGYEPKDPNLLEKVFYVVWSLVLGFRIAIRRLWRKVRH